MEVHQIITGALNKGESSFAVGSVEGINFTACAVGCDIVILASDFNRVQIIPGSDNGNVQVTCIDCCSESGKIAAAYLDIVRIFEPSPLLDHTSLHQLDYHWVETACFSASSTISNLSWNLEGLRLLVSTNNELQMWQHHWLSEKAGTMPEHTPESIRTEDGNRPELHNHATIYSCLWRNKLSEPIRYMKFSPDGLLFATAAAEDKLVKVWYLDQIDGEDPSNLSFAFLYLPHPLPVQGFEWRKTGRYMPRHCIGNVLITWCRDNVCRIWNETQLPDSGLLIPENAVMEEGGLDDNTNMPASINANSLPTRPMSVNQKQSKRFLKSHGRNKFVHRLKHLRHLKHHKKKRKGAENLEANSSSRELCRGMSSFSSVVYFDQPDTYSIPVVYHFHLAATISAETDCFLVPSMSGHASTEEQCFAVHWLNNKELMFSLGAEKLLGEALLAMEARENNGNEHGRGETLSDNNSDELKNGAVLSEGVDKPGFTLGGDDADVEVDELEHATISKEKMARMVSECGSVSCAQYHDVFELKMEALLREWHQSSDVLFSVHPVDGSLLVWTVDWLDEMSRQPQVSFSSRLPHAFPLTDAGSLQQSLATFNPHDPVFVSVLHRSQNGDGKEFSELPPQSRNTVFLLTSHHNGSLNLWHLTVDEQSKFSTILNIAHKSRICGHRFRISDISCHPVLPLLLTTSHHNIKQVKSKSPAEKPETPSGSGNPLVQYYNSELILWKVSKVGPLCKSGGVQELARINSPEFAAFSSVAWIPAILPSSTLGSVCNSPSSCFVASDGYTLRVYQAVIDARALISEVAAVRSKMAASTPTSSLGSSHPASPLRYVKDYAGGIESLHIVSSQSTARPGCVIDIGPIADADQDWRNIQLLHVFQDHLVLGDQLLVQGNLKTGGSKFPANILHQDSVRDVSKSVTFYERFYLVVVTKCKEMGVSVLHMWLIELSSQPSRIPAPESWQQVTGHLSVNGEEPDLSSPEAEMPSSRLTAKLFVRSSKVCEQSFTLPDKVKITDICPSAGHLSSTSIYPACMAPYLLVSACSDDTVRFWRCEVSKREGSALLRYEWKEWTMIEDPNRFTTVEMDGRPLTVSGAYSGRFACAIDPTNSFDTRKNDSVSIQVALFECESTGGNGWVQEDIIHLNNIRIPRASLKPMDFQHVVHAPIDDIMSDFVSHTGHSINRTNSHSLLPKIPSIPSMSAYSDMRRAVEHHSQRHVQDMPQKQMVRLDWVSTEDGGHILTVGVGPKIFLYAPVSEDIAQKNIIISKEGDTKKRPKLTKMSSMLSVRRKRLVRWVSMRTIELRSFDGRPPLPMMLGWVRDGILVVGMESEMRVYSQWNPKSVSLGTSAILTGDMKEEVCMINREQEPGFKPVNQNLLSVAHPTISLAISPSHSVLDLAKKNRDATSSAKRRAESLRSGADALAKADAEQQNLVDIVRDEGLFEAARMSSPMLPQYHPKQLMVLLNAGKIRRVKMILLYVLRAVHDRLMQQQVSARRVSSDDEYCPRPRSLSRTKSDVGGPVVLLDDSTLDYQEMDSVPPLRLYALLEADKEPDSSSAAAETDSGVSVGAGNRQNQYDGLFGEAKGEEPQYDDSAFDDDEDYDDETASGRRASMKRRKSVDSAGGLLQPGAGVFTAKHARMLTRYLTHTHLPGLSSVDQMHLLAVADTISSFSADAFDKLTQANLAYTQAPNTVIDSVSGGGYANVGSRAESVDECGLRFLMALKQHEYLLRCLPLAQRTRLKAEGLSTSHIIWALHSETETEIINSISALQTNPTWADMKNVGAGWWIKSLPTLRLCVEKVAKLAFQAKQDPTDAAVFYLAMRKKNILWGLYRSVRDAKMTEFFSHDFSEEKWRKAALKNAFVLMGKQRFQDAVAFFLLGNHLEDALQVCVNNLRDLQLALVIIRLYETDVERQSQMTRRILCQQVFGCEAEEFPGPGTGEYDLSKASPDPFLRSMTFWLLKDYHRALLTLLDEDDASGLGVESETMSSDVFNFYIFLRTHPLVVRQRLAEAQLTISSTEKYLEVAKALESQITLSERRLFFKTAFAHFKSGCAMLALEVLCKLPKVCVLSPSIGDVKQPLDDQQMIRRLSHQLDASPVSMPNGDFADGSKMMNGTAAEILESVDWGSSLIGGGLKETVKEDKLELRWSDDDEDRLLSSDEETKSPPAPHDGGMKKGPLANMRAPAKLEKQMSVQIESSQLNKQTDIMAQQLKFIACLKIFMEELATLASGYEVEGGQLRFQLYTWLEKEVEVLHKLCDYQAVADSTNILEGGIIEDQASATDEPGSHMLHEALRLDKADLEARISRTARRRTWLAKHHPLLRTLASYCSLHGEGLVGLASARMELLLLLQELHQEGFPWRQLASPVPVSTSFPLMAASIASYKTDIADPIRSLQSQTLDLLETISELSEVPRTQDSISKVFLLYNLAQCLSSCIYESLCDVENFAIPKGANEFSGVSSLIRMRGRSSGGGSTDGGRETEDEIVTHPSKWPGVQTLINLLSRERDEDSPNLRYLLVEAFVAVYLALFAYAFVAFDSRWLYRLMAHKIDVDMFGGLFGGGGEKKMVVEAGGVPPPRPPAPLVAREDSRDRSASPGGLDRLAGSLDPSKLRAKFHAKVFGPPKPDDAANDPGSAASRTRKHRTTFRELWIQPKMSIVAYFTAKPMLSSEQTQMEYDSDESVHSEPEDEDEEDGELAMEDNQQHSEPNSYAWLLLRTAAVRHACTKIHSFLHVCGFDPTELAAVSPLIHRCLRALEGWSSVLESELRNYPGGCPLDFLRNSTTDTSYTQGPSLQKYRVILERDNTPFRSKATAALPVKRLWLHLVNQETLMDFFVRYVFKTASAGHVEPVPHEVNDTTALQGMPEPVKIVQREQDPITAFATSSCNSGWIVVSTNRELQEMDISNVFTGKVDWIYDQTELDIALSQVKKQPLRDNDDYMLLTSPPNANADSGDSKEATLVSGRGSAFVVTPFILDRSRCGLRKLCKREVPGVKRMEGHPSLPYYLSGSVDGSVRMWEWGVPQPLYTPRSAGQFAKVTRVRFSPYGNKFAVADGDGVLSLWQICHGMTLKKPYLSFKCHTKTTTDFVFVNNSSSLMAAGGHSSGDLNVGLWDLLLPQDKALVHTWACHAESGSSCVLYVPQQQSIYSGGKHGELCIFDVRQRVIRQTFKVFDHSGITTLALDPAGECFVAGSTDGDIKIWSVGQPQPLHTFVGEHASRGAGFSFRNVGGTAVPGVAQLYVDSDARLFSCGADASLKLRVLSLPSMEATII